VRQARPAKETCFDAFCPRATNILEEGLALSKLGILACGGPAPGINSVIGAATIRASLAGVSVLGIVDGFTHLMKGDTSRVLPLDISSTSRIHFRGGSYIGIARGGPAGDAEKMQKTLDTLKALDISMLITIGGDGSAYVAYCLEKASAGTLRVVHVPKTIDNDIMLPNDMPTFGFQTARHVGVSLVENLMVDAKTTHRWYLVVAQGRKAGHLALSIGKAAGATLSLIPEEFPKETPLRTIADTIVGSMVKRLALDGRSHGVAVIAEGLVDSLAAADLAEVPRDERGNVSYTNINLARMLETEVRKRLVDLGVKLTVQSKEIGYELRCADPIPFDMEYTRDLGYSAAKYIVEGGSGALVTMQDGRFMPIRLASLVGTNGARVRMVDVTSDRYQIARSYMIRLRAADLTSSGAKLAAVTNRKPSEFAQYFDAALQLDCGGTKG
jgi:ATP-dependent phosphofructokinase / diphosphate-dependent phosphofructokinase